MKPFEGGIDWSTEGYKSSPSPTTYNKNTLIAIL
jgi:hypothetical protein